MSAAEDFAEIVRAHVGGMAVPAGDPWPGLNEATPPASETPNTAPAATPADDFAAYLDEQLGNVPAVEQIPDEPGPRMPAPNVAQGTSDGSTPRLSPGDMFVDFLSRQLGSYDPDSHPAGSAGPAAAGQSIGWRSA